MTAHRADEDLLSSWKEISDYLGCDERTCRRWELTHKLPVHRMEGTAKSRVYAYKSELDAWRKESLNGSPLEKEGAVPGAAKALRNGGELDRGAPERKPRKVLWLIPAATMILAALLYFFRSSPGEPVDFAIRGSKLAVLDIKGRKVCDFETGLDKLASEEEYRLHFQVRGYSKETNPAFPMSAINQPLLPLLAYKDIDRNGKTEILFCPKTTDEYNETGIFCLDTHGRKLWHYKPGREIDFGGTVYSAEYRVDGLEARDINSDGKLEIFMITSHQPHSPSGLVLLDCRGQLLGEFYNFGRFSDLVYADFDDDGTTEVAASGENDEYGKASLAVFKPSRIGGSSPQRAGPLCRPCGEGTELYYLLFPRTDLDLIMYPPKENIKVMHLLEGDRLELDTHLSHIYFELDFRFRVIGARGSDLFRETHRKMKAAGQIGSDLDPAYWEALKSGVLYWDGIEWTSTPSMNRDWDQGRWPR